ncbi:MAG: cytochrome C oxidase subunit IV family protein [Acidobacteriota bacterium]|nr:cytochrome C oxidase subunit IV family protein [Acidobacteriota bacterium]
MSGHVSSRKIYVFIFLALLAGTGLTVAAANVDMGPLNDVVALSIAVAKALLVILFFMHVRDSSRLTKLTVFAGFFWLLIMIVVTLSDYKTRGWLGSYASERISPQQQQELQQSEAKR